jgi:ATP-binding cassette subfamily C (CFTR/MRP) protein 1
MNSVERMQEYINKPDREASWTKIKPESWLKNNNYEFSNVRFKYRDNLPDVIKGITFKISNLSNKKNKMRKSG